MLDDKCIFCKIIKGDIPSYTIYEDDEFKVILDVGPVAKGHALILPKNHYPSMYELPEEDAVKVVKLARKMMVKMTKALECDGFNLVQNNGEAADQSVPHFHMHLIPRYQGGQKLYGYTPLEVPSEQMQEILEKIKG